MEVPTEIRALIIRLREEGQSFRKIAKTVNKSHATVQYIVNRQKEIETLSNRPRSGRPRKLDSNQRRAILRTVVENPMTSAPKLAGMVNKDYGVNVVPQTVRNVLKRFGYNGCTPRHKPFISAVNKRKRLDFAKSHVDKPTSFWNSVIFSDESKFNVFSSDGRGKVWRKPNEQLKTQNLCATVKHGGGNVLVWGCMSASGVGNLVVIDGIMDQYMYLDILRNNLKSSVDKLSLGSSFIFQQDNDPKHTAKRVKEWLIHNVPKQLHTPPQSPDMNPIEHLWDEIGRKIRTHNVRNKQQLKNAILTEWNAIDPDITKKLVNSMKNRLIDVIKAKGGSTRY